MSPATCALSKRLVRGINFGNMLDAPKEGGYGPWLQLPWIDQVKPAGFDHIRLPVRWSNHAAPTADATIGLDDDVRTYGAASFFGRIDEILDRIASNGLAVVLDMHHYRQLDGDPVEGNETAVDPAVVQIRAVNLWRQIATHYAGRHPGMAFELYNEPHNALDAGQWNLLYPKLLAAVRAADPTRTVIVDTENWANADRLATLAVPTDRNAIVSVHAYEPYDFTMQGTWGTWQNTTGVTCCTAAQQQKITASLDLAATWSANHGIPVYVGEFGASVDADATSRATYTAFVRQQMQARALGWAVWSFHSDFALYDVTAGAWNQPLVSALMAP